MYLYTYKTIHTLHVMHFTYTQAHTKPAPDCLCQPVFILLPHSPQHHVEQVKKVLLKKKKRK